MAEEEQETTIRPEIQSGRVKKIMKLDKDIKKVNSEALFLITCSTELFLKFLAERSADVAIEKKRKIVKLEHIRTAVKRHRPTSYFLLDSLPLPSQPSDNQPSDRNRSRPLAERPVPAGTRRIDDFFSKPANEAPVEINEA